MAQVISSRNILVSLILLLSVVPTPSKADQYSVACEKGTNYTHKKTPFQSNLESAFSLLNAASSNSYYLNASVGSAPDAAYATFMCRLDLPLTTCSACVANATSDLLTYCPTYWAAHETLAECAIQYANISLFSPSQTNYVQPGCEEPGMRGDPVLSRTIDETMSDLIDRATSAATDDGNIYRLATGEGIYMEYQKLHGLVQCSPEFTASDCRECLRYSMNFLPRWCGVTIGATSFGIGCGIKYDLYAFYNVTPNGLPLAPASQPPRVARPPSNASPVFAPGTMRAASVGIGLLFMRVYLG